MANYLNGYNNQNAWYNPQPFNAFMQPQNTGFMVNFVSDIAEVVATKPDVTGKPLFFYNKANEEIYVKQYDNTGNAPIKTFKLVVENTEQTNPYLDGLKTLNHKIDDIKKLLTPEIIDEAEKRSKK